MPRKPIVKLNPELDFDSFNVVACKDKKFQPFFNVFHFEGSNVAQSTLGDLFGVIQVFDYSKNSAYLPNLIAQVIKKEFFSNSKRLTEKAFEAALHKANLALTELAQHEIVEWMGNINAVIGVIYKNQFHFTQAGGGKILLIRNKVVLDVSENLDDGEGSNHPLKTFSNVSSGRLEEDDKIIFATETIFDAINPEEIRRHSNVFKSHEFDNIFRSTIELEGDKAGAVIINIKEKTLKTTPPVAVAIPEKEINFFGNKKKKEKQQAISENKVPEETKIISPQVEPISKPLKVDAIKENPGPPLETQSELYIKEDDFKNDISELEKKADIPDELSEKVKNYFSQSKEKFTESSQKIGESLKEKFFSISGSLNVKKPKLLKFSDEERKLKLNSLKISMQNTFSNFKEKAGSQISKISAKKELLPGINQSKTITNYLSARKKESLLDNVRNKISQRPGFSFSKADFSKIKMPQVSNPLENQKLQSVFKGSSNLIKNLIQKISEIKMPQSQKSLDRKKVIIGSVSILILILLIVLVKMFIFSSKKETPSQTETQNNQPSIVEEVTSNPNPGEVENIASLATLDSDALQVVYLEKDLFILTKNDNFYKFNTQSRELKKINLENGTKNIKGITVMPSLKLVFLVMPTAISSYSPVTEKFYSDNITLPAGMALNGSGTYLSYIYLLDKSSNQIYQYPRADGGFGEQKKWLKDATSLTSSTDMAIDGSVYISFSDGRIEKYDRGKKSASFNLGNNGTTLVPSKIKTAGESDPLYALDSNNGNILEISKDGNIQRKISNESLKEAKDFEIDQENKQIYFIDKNNQLMSFEL